MKLVSEEFKTHTKLTHTLEWEDIIKLINDERVDGKNSSIKIGDRIIPRRIFPLYVYTNVLKDQTDE